MRSVANGVVLGVLVLVLPHAAAAQESWAVTETAALSIDAEASGPASDLYGISGLAELSDGRIVIADRAQRLLVFDARGSHLRTFGRRGSGPGEFGSIQWIQRLENDSILVADWFNGRRLSYFTSDGEFVRSTRTAFSPPPTIVGALSDGTLIAKRIARRANLARSDSDVAWGRGEIEVLRLGSDASVLNSLGFFPDNESLLLPGYVRTTVQEPGSPLHATLVVAAGQRIYVATGDAFEVQRFSSEGENLGFVRLDYDPVRVRRTNLNDFFRDLLGGVSAAQRIPWNSLRWNTPDNQTLPAITALRVDEDGNLWVAERLEAPDARSTWHVFAPTGRYVARVIVLSGFRPLHIGSDSMLGVWRDDLDVEHVQIRSIVRP